MGLPKTKLEYVNSSGNWTQALTPGGQDAVVMLNISMGINTSSKCDVIMANQSPDPENSDPAQAKGNLTDVFTDFQRIRLVDQETGIVIFTGRIYRVRDKYDLQYGQTIRLYGFDAYKELIEYPIDDPPESLKSIDTTSSNVGGYDVRKRSQIIKYILSELDLNDNIAVSDTDHWDDSWSTNSLQDKDLNISKIDRRIAGVIQDLAIGDPLKNVSGTDIGESGYDFRVEPYFTSCAVDHKPIEMMNYFQRGTRPGRGGAYSNESSPTLCTTSTDSLTIQYPSDGDTGLKRSMLSSFEFDKPKEELYTALILHYKDESQEEQNANQEGSSEKEGVVTFELFKGTTNGTFTWADKALNANKSTPTELLNISGGATGVARVQWHESNYLLVSDIDDDNFPTTGSITLVGASSGATFVMNAATQRMVTKLGVKRPVRISRNLTSDLYALRKEVVARLIGRTDLEIVRGKFQTVRYPFVYHDLPSNASRSSNTVSWSGTVDAHARGIRKAYVIAQVDSNGNYIRYAYISAVNSATSITYGTTATDTSDGTALDVTDTIRLIIPLRPGDIVKAVHTTSNINTDQVILELIYDEAPGLIGANYTTVGSNGKFNNIFSDSDALKSAIAQAQSKRLPPEQPLSEQAFVFDGFINRGSNPADSNDYRKIHWSNSAGATSGTAGTLTAGDGTKYTIACASSATLTEAEYTFFFRPTSAKATINKSNTTFQLVLATSYVKDPSDIRLGWAKAVPTKAGAKAILVLAPQLQSRDLFAAGGIGTLTDALFSKSAQEYASGLEIKPVTSGQNKHRRVTWAACTSAEDRLTFGDGDYWSIAADGGNYSYTANGSSYTNLTLLDVSSTYYVFIDTADTASGGTLTLRFTKSYSHISTASDGTYSSARVIMGQIAVPANGDDGAAPRIFPFNNRSLTINAASIAADAITATHITAGTVTTIRQGTTKSDVGLGNVDNDSTSTVRGGVTPIHVTDNMTGVTMNQNGDIYSGSKTTYQSNTSGWFIGFDQTQGTPADHPRINIGSGSNRLRWTGSALEIIGQIQLTSGGDALSEANTFNANQAWSQVGGSGRPDDNATEGLGGTGFKTSDITTDLTGGSASLPTFTGSDTILDSKGICGFASNALQFYILSSTGKAYFAAGNIIGDSSGLHIKQSGSTKYLNFENSSGSLQSAIYTADPITRWFTPNVGNTDPTSTGKEIVIGSSPDPQHPTNSYRDIPQTKSITLTAAYIGIHPKERTEDDGPIYYQFPDGAPSDGQVLSRNGSTFTKTIAGDSSATIYPLDWVSVSGGGSYTHPDPIQLGSGSASSPTYSFSTVTDSGLYRYSVTDAIGFSIGGNLKLILGYYASSAYTSYLYTNLVISGSLSKSSGTFKIPHPLDEENKTLVHGFVESPRYDLVYRGIATLSDGTATASIDEASNNMTVGTFTALTKNPQVWAQNETGWGAVKGRVEDGNIIITAEDTTSSDTISWLVIAERNDTYINSSNEPWTDENGTFVPEWDTAAIPGPPPL